MSVGDRGSAEETDLGCAEETEAVPRELTSELWPLAVGIADSLGFYRPCYLVFLHLLACLFVHLFAYIKTHS